MGPTRKRKGGANPPVKPPNWSNVHPKFCRLLEPLVKQVGLFHLNDLLAKANKMVKDLPKIAGFAGKNGSTQLFWGYLLIGCTHRI